MSEENQIEFQPLHPFTVSKDIYEHNSYNLITSCQGLIACACEGGFKIYKSETYEILSQETALRREKKLNIDENIFFNLSWHITSIEFNCDGSLLLVLGIENNVQSLIFLNTNKILNKVPNVLFHKQMLQTAHLVTDLKWHPLDPNILLFVDTDLHFCKLKDGFIIAHKLENVLSCSWSPKGKQFSVLLKVNDDDFVIKQMDLDFNEKRSYELKGIRSVFQVNYNLIGVDLVWITTFNFIVGFRPSINTSDQFRMYSCQYSAKQNELISINDINSSMDVINEHIKKPTARLYSVLIAEWNIVVLINNTAELFSAYEVDPNNKMIIQNSYCLPIDSLVVGVSCDFTSQLTLPQKWLKSTRDAPGPHPLILLHLTNGDCMGIYICHKTKKTERENKKISIPGSTSAGDNVESKENSFVHNTSNSSSNINSNTQSNILFNSDQSLNSPFNDQVHLKTSIFSSQDKAKSSLFSSPSSKSSIFSTNNSDSHPHTSLFSNKPSSFNSTEPKNHPMFSCSSETKSNLFAESVDSKSLTLSSVSNAEAIKSSRFGNADTGKSSIFTNIGNTQNSLFSDANTVTNKSSIFSTSNTEKSSNQAVSKPSIFAASNVGESSSQANKSSSIFGSLNAEKPFNQTGSKSSIFTSVNAGEHSNQVSTKSSIFSNTEQNSNLGVTSASIFSNTDNNKSPFSNVVNTKCLPTTDTNKTQTVTSKQQFSNASPNLNSNKSMFSNESNSKPSNLFIQYSSSINSNLILQTSQASSLFENSSLTANSKEKIEALTTPIQSIFSSQTGSNISSSATDSKLINREDVHPKVVERKFLMQPDRCTSNAVNKENSIVKAKTISIYTSTKMNQKITEEALHHLEEKIANIKLTTLSQIKDCQKFLDSKLMSNVAPNMYQTVDRLTYKLNKMDQSNTSLSGLSDGISDDIKLAIDFTETCKVDLDLAKTKKTKVTPPNILLQRTVKNLNEKIGKADLSLKDLENTLEFMESKENSTSKQQDWSLKDIADLMRSNTRYIEVEKSKVVLLKTHLKLPSQEKTIVDLYSKTSRKSRSTKTKPKNLSEKEKMLLEIMSRWDAKQTTLIVNQLTEKPKLLLKYQEGKKEIKVIQPPTTAIVTKHLSPISSKLVPKDSYKTNNDSVDSVEASGDINAGNVAKFAQNVAQSSHIPSGDTKIQLQNQKLIPIASQTQIPTTDDKQKSNPYQSVANIFGQIEHSIELIPEKPQCQTKVKTENLVNEGVAMNLPEVKFDNSDSSVKQEPQVNFTNSQNVNKTPTSLFPKSQTVSHLSSSFGDNSNVIKSPKIIDTDTTVQNMHKSMSKTTLSSGSLTISTAPTLNNLTIESKVTESALTTNFMPVSSRSLNIFGNSDLKSSIKSMVAADKPITTIALSDTNTTFISSNDAIQTGNISSLPKPENLFNTSKQTGSNLFNTVVKSPTKPLDSTENQQTADSMFRTPTKPSNTSQVIVSSPTLNLSPTLFSNQKSLTTEKLSPGSLFGAPTQATSNALPNTPILLAVSQFDSSSNGSFNSTKSPISTSQHIVSSAGKLDIVSSVKQAQTTGLFGTQNCTSQANSGSLFAAQPSLSSSQTSISSLQPGTTGLFSAQPKIVSSQTRPTGLFHSQSSTTSTQSGSNGLFSAQPNVASPQSVSTGLFSAQPNVASPQSVSTGLFSAQPNIASPQSASTGLFSAQPNIASPQSASTGLFSAQPNIASPQSASTGLFSAQPNVASPQSVSTGLFSAQPNVASPQSVSTGLFSAQPNVASPQSVSTGLFSAQPNIASPQSGSTGLFSAQPNVASPQSVSTGLFSAQPNIASPQSGSTGLFSAQPNIASPQSGSTGLFGAQSSITSQKTGLFGSQSTQAASNSLFTTQQASNPSQSVSTGIFGNQQTVPSQATSSGLFGTQQAAVTHSSGSFGGQSNIGGIFDSQSSSSVSHGLFGQSTITTVQSSGLFGQASTKTSQPTHLFNCQNASDSIFSSGSTSVATQPTQGTSLFCSQSNNIQQPSSGLFASNQKPTSGLFGNQINSAFTQQNSNGLFSNQSNPSAGSNRMFVSSNSQSAPSTQNQLFGNSNSDLFNNTNSTAQSPFADSNNTSSMMGSSFMSGLGNQSVNTSTNIFGSPNSAKSGGSGLFANSQQNAPNLFKPNPNATNSLFGSSAQSPNQQHARSSLFGAAPTFANPTSGVFGNNVQPSSPFGSANQQTNVLFTSTSASPGSLFGTTANQPSFQDFSGSSNQSAYNNGNQGSIFGNSPSHNTSFTQRRM